MKTRTRSLVAASALVLASSAGGAFAQDASGPTPGYYIAEFVPEDMQRLQPYSEQVESTFAPYGGRYVVRGGDLTSLEGDAPDGRFIMIAFDDVEQARAWYASDEYQELIPVRQASGTTNTYIVEGMPD